MNNSLSELINHATQCLIDLGLSPETIKCYQCSAFHPLERKLENQKNISSSMLMEQEGYFGKQFRRVKYPGKPTTGESVAFVYLQKYVIQEDSPGKYTARRKR